MATQHLSRAKEVFVRAKEAHGYRAVTQEHAGGIHYSVAIESYSEAVSKPVRRGNFTVQQIGSKTIVKPL